MSHFRIAHVFAVLLIVLLLISDLSVSFCCTGHIDVDCGLSTSDVPSVTGILESPACCSMHCEGDDCVPRQDRCSQVTLQVINATYDATCRFQVSTVSLYITL